MHNQQLPPGYSANDIVAAPTANKPVSQPSQGLPPGYSPDDIISKPGMGMDQGQQPHSDELQSAGPNADFADKAAHAIAGTFEGIGEGVFGTAAGATDLFGGKGTGISQALHKLAGDENTKHGTAQNIGRGAETIGEFILGDEALKGLSFADKLKHTSSVMKLLEKTPRLQKALQLGINIGKAGTELGPEERALLKQYPTLARLVGLGMDSVRAGVVQGAQTLTKTGGDAGQAVKEGAGMAAGSAILGAPFATLGGALSKGAEAAKTAEGLQSVAQNAPTGEQLGEQLGSTVKNAVQPQIDDATKALAEANEKKAGIASVAEGLGEEAPTKQAITSKAQAAVQAAHTALNTAYEDSASKITKELSGVTIPFKGSEIHDLAKDILIKSGDPTILKKLEEAGKTAATETDPLKAAFDMPNPVSETVKNIAKRLYGVAEKAGKDEGKEPVKLTAEGLMDYAKKIKENLRSTGWATAEDRADRDAYFKMLDAIHNDYYNLADKAGKPELTEALNDMNAAYKEGIQKFSHPDVKKILQGNSEGNIMKLLQGTGSVKDIQTIKSTIGKHAYGELVDNSLQRMAADSKNPQTGEFDFNSFFKKMNAIDPEVRAEMLDGTTKGGPIELALSQFKHLNASEVIPDSETTIKEATKLMDGMIGKGNVDKLISDPQKVQDLSKLIGPEAMGQLGQSVIANAMRDAATDAAGKVGKVDVNKLMDYFGKFKDKPEIVDALFRPTPESAEAYSKALADIKNIQGAKTMVKLGLIPAGLAVGSLVGHVVGHPFWGLIIAAAAERNRGGKLLEYLADHPATWRTIKALDTVAKKPAAEGVGMLGKYAAGRASVSALNQALSKGASSTLGQQ